MTNRPKLIPLSDPMTCCVQPYKVCCAMMRAMTGAASSSEKKSDSQGSSTDNDPIPLNVICAFAKLVVGCCGLQIVHPLQV